MGLTGQNESPIAGLLVDPMVGPRVGPMVGPVVGNPQVFQRGAEDVAAQGFLLHCVLLTAAPTPIIANSNVPKKNVLS